MKVKVISNSQLLFGLGDALFTVAYVVFFYRAGLTKDAKGFAFETLLISAVRLCLRNYSVFMELQTFMQFLHQSQSASPNILNTLWVAFMNQKTATYVSQFVAVVSAVAACYLIFMSKLVAARTLKSYEPVDWPVFGAALVPVFALFYTLNPSFVLSRETVLLLSYLLEIASLIPQLRVLLSKGPSSPGIFSSLLFTVSFVAQNICYLLAWKYTGELDRSFIDILELRISAEHAFRVSVVISTATSLAILVPFIIVYFANNKAFPIVLGIVVVPVAVVMGQYFPDGIDNYFVFRHVKLLQATQVLVMLLFGGTPYVSVLFLAVAIMQRMSPQ